MPNESLPGTLIGALFRPRALFSQLQPGPVAPAAKHTALFMVLPALAAMLTDDDFPTKLPQVLLRGLMMWGVGTVWLLGPQAAIFRFVMRLFGGVQPLSLAQRGMAAFSALLAVFGVIISVAGISPESAPFVITWYLSLVALLALGTYALFWLANAFDLRGGKAFGAVVVFEILHGLALVITLGVLFTIVSP